MIPPSEVHTAKIVGRPTIFESSAGAEGWCRVGGTQGTGRTPRAVRKKRSFCATDERVSSSLKSARPVPAAREAGPGRHGGAPGPVANERSPVNQHATSRTQQSRRQRAGTGEQTSPGRNVVEVA